jgi:hypothetical protein
MIMASRGNADDLSALLYLVPFIGAGAYGLLLWVQSGISAILPSGVYLTVTRDPALFAVGSLAVMLGVVVEARAAEPASRQAKLASVSGTLQVAALASLILTLIAALYANGFLDVTGAATDFIVGRYGLVFPAMLVLLSYLITVQFKLDSLRSPKTLGIIALLLVPVSIYEIGKRQTALGLGVALVLLIVGLAPYLLPARAPAKVKDESSG